MKNSATILMLILVLLSACTNDNDNIPQPNTGEINPEKIFKSITGDLNGFDEFAYNENSCIFYKAQESGLPETMLVYVNDEEGEIFEFVYFDEQGIPEYFNINGESVYVSNVRGELCDLLILCDDGTFTTIPDIETGIDINSYWSEQHATRTSGNSNISGAMNMANRILGATNLMQGTLDMGFGAYYMLLGCSMLLPGCNIVLGARLAIGGLAAFTSGAMMVARATDLLVSDGTHTDGLYEATSNALGAVSTVCTGIGGGVGKEVLNSAINEGIDLILNTFDKRAQELEHKKAAHQTQAITLTTLEFETDIIDCSATLHGAISSTMAAGDSVGIFISEDPSAMHVIGYDETIANSGDFSFTFDNLERCESYFYRAYYYNAQQQRTFIARRGEFYIPGVQTGGYTETVDGCYDVILKAMLGEQTRNAGIGICYSSDDEEPTIDSNSTELLSITNSGDYTFELCPDELPCYYRAYMVVDDDNIIYGDTKTIYADDREILIKFYHDTGGDNWERNDNWCSEKPIDEWYGVYVDDNGRVLEILLGSNNLKGKGTLSGCTALTYLYCDNNQLTSLDVSGCTALEYLFGYDNQLTSLDASGCTALTFLACCDNQLTSLDVSGCTALTYLDCYDNQLTSLDVSGCTALESLDCVNNQLMSLDVSGCTALEYLFGDNNQLTSLDVSGCTALTYLDCDNNQLTSLDVSGCTALEYLFGDNNQLTSLDVSECTALKGLSCCNNQLTSLDASGCTALEWLECMNNQLTSLDVSGCSALRSLYCENRQLTSLDVSGCTALEDLHCSGNQLTSLDVSGCTALESLYCYDNHLTSLDVSGCTALTNIDCENNQLTSLDVSGCTALTGLSCHDNQLTSLDVSGCTALTGLSCHDNQLTSLDVSGCTAFESLSCYDNQLTSLDVSGCTALESLSCHNNQLTSLDVSGCTALESLSCHNNQLTSLDVSGCTALYSLSCHNNQLTSLDVSGCTALESLTYMNSQLTSLDASGCTALTELNCRYNQLTSLDASGCTALEWLDCRDNQLTQEITGIFAEIEDFRYDVRYEYYRDADGLIKYRDRGKGWWYPGEPGRGYHGK